MGFRAAAAVLGLSLCACTPQITEGRFGCTTDEDCPPELVCRPEVARCYRSLLDAGPPVDAGLSFDAGPVDAGSPDAGPVDAGRSDAGLIDAGAPDAGPNDAGPTDAGPTDAGPTDAGAPDAGPDDAGPTDAGPFDAGPDAA